MLTSATILLGIIVGKSLSLHIKTSVFSLIYGHTLVFLPVAFTIDIETQES